MSSAPRTSRPHMPEYGLEAGDVGGGLLPWSWAVRPLVVFGFIERAEVFAGSATRWTFSGGA